MPAGFTFDHWPYSLAVAVPFLLVATGRALWEWRRDRRADRLAREDEAEFRTRSGNVSPHERR